MKWIDDRFPFTETMKYHVTEYYASKNFNIWYVFGVLAIVVLVIQLVTGIFLTMNYKPSAAEAFASVEYIMRDVEWGWLIRYMHSTGASFFFIVVYLHMFRGMLYGSYKKPRELIWIIGMLIFFVLMAEAFAGYLLPWGQMSYWGAQVIISLFGAIPWVGDVAGRIHSRRLLDLRHHAESLFRAARHRVAAGADRPGLRPHRRTARGRLEQPGRHRNQGTQGSGWRAARRRRISSVSHSKDLVAIIVFLMIFCGGRVLCTRNGRLFPRARQLRAGQRYRKRRRSTLRRCGTSRRSTQSCVPYRTSSGASYPVRAVGLVAAVPAMAGPLRASSRFATAAGFTSWR